MPIKVLTPQLVNQIAAGEVVDRPAAVVKELVENSLDAGANHIQIDIEMGGANRIRIQDNGCGIHKNELLLALTRHATSKITNLEDLQRITSMGFRGEALASVSAVSRIMLTSRTNEQNEAWQVYAEGYNLSIMLRPTAHPVGTTVDVLDLFYNIPARRKFMRTAKTEFTHIDEVVRRMALARFDVTFILQHNGKIVRHYRALNQTNQQYGQQYLRRLSSLCGTQFVDCALAVAWQQSKLALRGWIAAPACLDELNEMRYIYVNLRIIRDKLINHAIRQAYQDQLTGRAHQPAFVLFLDVAAHQLDSNVHPTKSEVRFYQAQLVHDFIYRAIFNVLQQSVSVQLPLEKETKNNFGSQHKSKKGKSSTVIARCSSVYPYAPKPAGSVVDRHDWRTKKCKLYQKLLDQQFLTNPPEKKIQHNICARSKMSEDYGSGSSAQIAVATTAAQPKLENLHSFGHLLTLVSPYYGLLQSGQNLLLLSLPVAERCLLARKLTPDQTYLRAQPLLIPLDMTLSEKESAALKNYQTLLQEMGINLQVPVQQETTVTVNAVPLPLLRQQKKLQNLIPELLGYLHGKALMTHHEVAAWLASRLQLETIVWSYSRAIQLLTEVERLCPPLVITQPDELLVTLNLDAAIKALNHV